MANTRITGDYATHTKEELLAEITARRTDGKTIDGTPATLKDDLVAALDLDDHSKPAPTPKAPAATASNPLVDAPNIPTIESSPNIPIATDDVPKLSEYSGLWTNASDGEQYALAVKENAPDGKTHFLLNTRHFDNCTKEEFKLRYEKRDEKK